MRTHVVLFVGWIILLPLLLGGCRSGQGLSAQLPREAVEKGSCGIAVGSDSSTVVVAGGLFIGLLQEPRPGFALVLDLKRHKVQKALTQQTDGCSGVVIVHDGTRGDVAAVAGFDGSVQLLGLEDDSPPVKKDVGVGPICAIALTADKKRFVVGGASRQAMLLAVCDSAGNVLRRYEYASGQELISSISCSPDGAWIAFCRTASGEVSLINMASGQLQVLRSSQWPLPRSGKPLHADFVNTVAFTSAGLLVMTVEEWELKQPRRGWIEVWDIDQNKVVASGRRNQPVGALSTSGDVVVSVEGDARSVHLWRMDLTEILPAPPLQGVSDMEITADGRQLYYVTTDGLVGVADLKTEHSPGAK